MRPALVETNDPYPKEDIVNPEDPILSLTPDVEVEFPKTKAVATAEVAIFKAPPDDWMSISLLFVFKIFVIVDMLFPIYYFIMQR